MLLEKEEELTETLVSMSAKIPPPLVAEQFPNVEEVMWRVVPDPTILIAPPSVVAEQLVKVEEVRVTGLVEE